MPTIEDQKVALTKILTTSFRRTINEDYDVINEFNNKELATNIPDATIEAISAILSEAVIEYNSKKKETDFQDYHERIMDIIGALEKTGNSRVTGLSSENVNINQKTLRPVTALKTLPSATF